jgi:hypothetical protein
MFQYVGSPTIIEKIQYGKMLGIISMGSNDLIRNTADHFAVTIKPH